ncbi:adenylyl-sulfate kinase [Mucilaginibacter paludis]|uniref:Adenylyl-sulfate kinase n=1 Tax=Mucilaginibacter paludis DSM 18603 TaxID=714943 RepID=H1Y2A7_9SPHI|nr:adenylyl-sulfate kinase [Mucilaginibacter paludis]EHQ27887.1 Adenylyl-sulfate kinase [Mucilaginibacter paludis DSM 18603]
MTEQEKPQNQANLFYQASKVTRRQRETVNQNAAFTIWFTGLSGAGKSTIATELDSWLFDNHYYSYVLDGDNTRIGINKDLSFSRADRGENIRRVAEICKLFNDAGIICIASFISPFADDRQKARDIIGPDSFIETFIDTSIETCKQRDTKGLYQLAESGMLPDFTGISSPFDLPLNPDIHIKTDLKSVDECVNEIIITLARVKKIREINLKTLPTSADKH